MTKRHLAFDDVLDRAIDDVRGGRPLADVLGDYPSYADDLRPLLQVIAEVGAAPPRHVSLEEKYAIVHAALLRERAKQASVPRAAPVRWWRRPLTVASVSIPGGIAAIMTLSLGGAAAAAIAVTPAAFSDVLPARVAQMVTFSDGDDGDDNALHVNPTAPGQAGDVPGDDNRPTETSISGVVSDVNGNTFTVSSPEGDWKVNVDSSTTVSGDISDGASAEVTGDVTAEKNLHAEDVQIIAPGTPEPTKSTGPDKTPGGQEERTPPGQDPERTPPGREDDRTPPGQVKTPDATERTPPGQERE